MKMLRPDNYWDEAFFVTNFTGDILKMLNRYSILSQKKT